MRSLSIIIMISLLLSTLLIFVPSDNVDASVITVSTDGSKMYTTIQEAVDAASTGDEILISSGTYDEVVSINTSSLTLTGVKGQTFITNPRWGSNVRIYKDNVTISGFTINDDPLSIYQHSNDTTIKNCSISSLTIGIKVYRSVIENNTIGYASISDSYNCYFYNNTFTKGIMLYGQNKEQRVSHSIPDSNALNGGKIGYFKEMSGGTITDAYSQIIITDCTSVIVKDQHYNDTIVESIRVISSDMITITNISFKDCLRGVIFYDSNSCTIGNSKFNNSIYPITIKSDSNWNWISNCEIINCSVGIWTYSSNNTIQDSIFIGGKEHNYGIIIDTGRDNEPSKDNLVNSCDFIEMENGIMIRSNDNSIIDSTFINSSDYGIIIENFLRYQSEDNQIKSCNFIQTRGRGIDISDGIGTLVDSCTFNSTKDQIRLWRNINTTISNSTFIKNWYSIDGIVFSGSSSTLIENNQFKYGTGFESEQSEKSIIRSNVFYNKGFQLFDDSNSLVYNNKFISCSAYGSSGTIWNISKTPGTNIIGGPYLGGNYWSNYTGLDLDGDGIGDTDLPHWPGDQLPLQYDLVPPSITDQTSGDPTTGDMFEIRASPVDERLQVFPTLEYWFGGDGVHTNGSMIVCNPWGLDILVPSDSLEPLHYICSVQDSSGNWNSTSIITREIVDNDPPVFTIEYNGTDSIAIGKNIQINVSGTDNIDLSEFLLFYLDVYGIERNMTVPYKLHSSLTIPAQERAGSLVFWAWGEDSSGNTNVSDRITFIVHDKVPPIINIIHPKYASPMGGMQNILIDATDPERHLSWVSGYLEGDIERNGTYSWTPIFNTSTSGGLVNLSWDTSIHEDGPYLLIINASDISGNVRSVSVEINLDNTKPIADVGEDREIRIGDSVQFDGYGSTDNWGGVPVDYKWKIIPNILEYEMEGPEMDYTFHYIGTYYVILNVTDGAGNWDTDTITITVLPLAFAPWINYTSITDNEMDVDIFTTITIKFTEKMNRTSVASSMEFKPIESYSLEWKDDDHTLEISFPDGLQENTEYTLTLNFPRSVDGLNLDPLYFYLTFTTVGVIYVEILITFPAEGDEVKIGGRLSVTGTVLGSEPGDEIGVTFGGRTFSSTIGSSGAFNIEIIAPEEIGSFPLMVFVEDGQKIININVVDQESDKGDNYLRYIGLILILIALILGVFIWVRRGNNKRYVDEE